MKTLASAVVVLLATTQSVFAGCAIVPEIDPAAAPAALALLSGALLVIRGRHRR